ncbi:MAG: hypothetical protein IJ328_03300 [Muribaculaceae bacterium]|nr:hypothetical protein [Muribaculaceae bacterium]
MTMNFKSILSVVLSICSMPLIAQNTALEAQEQTNKYTDYYYQRKSLFAELPITSNDIVFFGNSLTNGGRWHEMFNNPNIKNRGIVGDIVQGLYDRADMILKGQPKKIFLLIGTNDISHHVGADSIAKALDKLITLIKKDCPNTQLYMQSLLPFNNDFKRYKNLFGEEMTVLQGNVLYEQVARKHNVPWINLFPWFADNECKLRKELTNDGVHLKENGYKIWRDEITPFVAPGINFHPTELYPIDSDDIIMLGGSLVGYAEWQELTGMPNVKTRSMGDVCDYLHASAKKLAQNKPKKIVMLSSYNYDKNNKKVNVSAAFNVDTIVMSMEKAIKAVKEVSPETEIILQSVIPVNSSYEKYAGFKTTGKKLAKTNKELKKLAKKYKVTWVDLTPVLADDNGELKAEYTNDGYHLMGKGYIAWRNALKPYLTK